MKTRSRKILVTALVLVSLSVMVSADDYQLLSPDQKTKAEIICNSSLSIKVTNSEKEIFRIDSISLVVQNRGTLGQEPKIVEESRQSVDQTLIPEVRVKSEKIRENYNELTLKLEGDYSLVIRLYDDCFAYRFITSFSGEFKIIDETASFSFPAHTKVYFPTEESFLTHSERNYEYLAVEEIPSGKMSCLPALFEIPEGPKVALLESALFDYPGLYLEGNGDVSLSSLFPRFALEEERTRDRTVKVSKRADYLAQVSGPRSFPWRAFVIAENDADLITNQSVYLLAEPSRIDDISWIRPGKVSWDWWNANNLYNVPFAAGINTETYKYYIDFAAKYDLEYVILDEGWSEPADIFKINPDIDMEELSRYAAEKKVGLILWVVWKALDEKLEEALDQFARWDVKGIKVDFMQRDDQWMVNYYWRVAEAAAKRKLLVDFHGSYKPAGLRRTYPNVITREGVKGLENYKWSDNPSPDHNLTLPFIRMLAGPMDYTPGAMHNSQRENFRHVFNKPMSLGTRCHQLAMYIVYESPLQMLADSPSNYLRQPECMEFLSKVPSVWDETRVIKAKVGDYLVLARRSGETWYLGGMTDETGREFDVTLDFLEDAQYQVRMYQDGINADRNGVDYSLAEKVMSRGNSIKIKLAKIGGFAAVFTKK